MSRTMLTLRAVAAMVIGLGVLLAASIGSDAAFADSTSPDTPSSQTATPPRIDGSFIQPSLVDGLTDAQLSSEESTLTRAGLTSQALQWTADSGAGTTVYASGLSGYRQSTNTDVLGRLLTAADAAGLTEYVGLQVNDDWWTKHANDPDWLQAQAGIATDLADDIQRQYGSHPSLGGWYLPFEVDNVNFLGTDSWAAMAEFYSTVADHLHALTPGLPVIIAPFFNATLGQTPQQWTTMWASILGSASIDVVALQDGVGEGHATKSDLPTWFGATAAAINQAGADTALWADTETYIASPDGTSFHPLSVAAVAADMAQVKPYVSRVLSFSYDHYYSPVQVGPLWDATYRAYLSSTLR